MFFFFKRMWPTKTVATTLKSRFFVNLQREDGFLHQTKVQHTSSACGRRMKTPLRVNMTLKWKKNKKNKTWSICGKCLSIMKVLHSARTRTGGWRFTAVLVRLSQNTRHAVWGGSAAASFLPGGENTFLSAAAGTKSPLGQKLTVL